MANQVQYMVTPTCCNQCDFCLRDNRDEWEDEKTISRIHKIYENIDYIDWENKYADGISLIGGEIFYMTDENVINEFLKLIDKCCDVIIPSSPTAKISFVSNGLYDPNVFLFKVLDRIRDKVGIDRLDMNFSYDEKYRYHTEERRQQAINTMKDMSKRYNYIVGVQTILTQYLIEMLLDGRFSFDRFENEICDGCVNMTLLYPHPINPKLKPIDDFQFDRRSFIKFAMWLKENYPRKYDNFYLSCENSAIKKETGSLDIDQPNEATMQPILSSGKEIINARCNHSMLYQCYSDSNKCMLCDLYNIGR